MWITHPGRTHARIRTGVTYHRALTPKLLATASGFAVEYFTGSVTIGDALMARTVTCPACERILRLPDQAEGLRLECPSCHHCFAEDSSEAIQDVLPATPPPLPPALPEPVAESPFRFTQPVVIPPPKPVRTSRGLNLRIVFGVAGLFILLMGVLFFLPSKNWPQRQQKGSPFAEAPEERREDVKEAFRPQGPQAEDARARDLRGLFEALGEGYRTGDSERIISQFNLERVMDDMVAQNVAPREATRDRTAFLRGMRTGMSRSLAQQSALISWESTEIRQIKSLSADEAVVIARHRRANGVTLKYRWWVTRISGSWRVYDFENLDMGVRMSAMFAEAARLGEFRAAEIRPATQAIHAALMALNQDDLDQAREKIRLAKGAKLPASLEAQRLMVTAMIHVRRNENEEALETLDQLKEVRPDMPMANLIRGTALNQMGKWDKAVKPLEEYRDLLGEDDEICVPLGLALRGVRRFADAAAAYRAALNYNPKNVEAFDGLLNSLAPDDRRDDIPARFARLDNRIEHFVTFAEMFKGNHDGVALAQLAQEAHRLHPESTAAAYYLALAKAWTGHPDQAIPLYREVVAGEKDAPRLREYTNGFLEAMGQAGKAVPAYAIAPDPREAFAVLAGETMKAYDTEELRELVAVHSRKVADDPLLPFYLGEIQVRDQSYAQAEKSFTKGMAHPPVRSTLHLFRASRVQARYHTGRALSAYEEIGPREETFEQLANLLLWDKKDADLLQLLDAHALTDPDNVDIARYRCQLQVRQGKTSNAVALFKAALAKNPQEQKRQRLVDDFLASMVGAGKVVEAYQAAPDPDAAFATLAEDLNEQDRRDDLKKLLDAHRLRHADDPWLKYYTGHLLTMEEKWEEAARVLGQAWREAPADLRNRFRWLYVNALMKAGRPLQAYGEVTPTKDTFNQLATLLITARKAAELEELLTAHRPHAGEDPAFLLIEARARIVAGRPTQAVARFRDAYDKQTVVEQKHWYISNFVREMAEAGHGLEAYRGSPERNAAFDALAGHFLAHDKLDELERLLAEHEQAGTKDALFFYYEGKVRLGKGELAAADRRFTEALKTAPQNRDWAIRDALYQTRVKAGKTVETYRELGGGRKSFDTLASVCQREKNASELESLLAAHHAATPDDTNHPGWEVEVAWLKKDYAGTLQLVKENRDDVLSRPRFRWHREDYLIRCLVHLKRSEEAVREAEAIAKTDGNRPLLLLLARATRGGVKEAVAAAEAVGPSPYQMTHFYHDPDLGPLLRSEPFAAFRQKYPEPKE